MFNFTYAPGTTLKQMLGFEIAGRVWDAYLNDNVTINLHVSMVSSSSLPTNVIGGALPAMRANAVYLGFTIISLAIANPRMMLLSLATLTEQTTLGSISLSIMSITAQRQVLKPLTSPVPMQSARL